MSNTVRRSCSGPGKYNRVRNCGGLKIESDQQKTNQILCGCSECNGCQSIRLSKQNHRHSRIKLAQKYINDWDVKISAAKDHWNCGRRHDKYGRKYSYRRRVFSTIGPRARTITVSIPAFNKIYEFFPEYYREVL